MEQKVILITGIASGFGRAMAGTLAGRIAKIIELRHPADNYVIASFLQRLSVFAKWMLPSRIFARLLSAYYRL